ncbi:MAG: hypothetical protein IJ501_04960 [Bacilli bacterium]|nr:hypothetical protein [Bacilli bacterium]
MKKKRKLKIKNVILLLVIIVFIGASIIIFTGGEKKQFFEKTDNGYLGSTSYTLDLFCLIKNEETDEESLEKKLELIRGSEIKYYPDSKYTYNELEYTKIEYENNFYYVLTSSIVDSMDSVVMEENLYVRTSYNLLKDLDGNLLSLVKKGSSVEITGYNELLPDGSVDLYKVKVGEEEGYFYSKYLVSTEEESLKNYDPEGIYKTHESRGDKLGGGSAATLDYYPREKVSFEDNKMPEEVYALYINGAKGIKNSIQNYIDYAKTTKINAFVVDIKDNSVPAYKSSIYEKYSPTNYKYANNSVEDYKYAINLLKENGFYVIGRITTFKDDYYAKDNPNNVISKTDGSMLKHSGSYWPSPYNRDVWKFTVDLAKEAVNLFGFNEIQFDYVRFPDRISSYKNIDFKNKYEETKAEAIQRFLMYATDSLHELNVYVSADVFGESSWGYVTAYGQYWPAISNVVDAISAMPYTDHFDKKESSWNNPYQTMLNWGKTAATRQTETPSPAVARTWITAYDTPYWNPTVTYNGEMLTKQIKGLYDAGLTGGYMTWNSGSNLAKYKSQKSAFNINYLDE